MRAREPIARLRRIVRELSQHRRVDDEGSRRHLQDPLDTASPLPLLDDLEEAFALELAQVVVEFLGA